jgi:hypothetical protein
MSVLWTSGFGYAPAFCGGGVFGAGVYILDRLALIEL